MARTIKLVLLGFMPLVIGHALNYAMLSWLLYGWKLNIISVALLLLWGLLAYCAAAPGKSPAVQALLLCAVGVLMLLLVLCRDLVLGQYWPGIVGFSTQMYFLPLMSLSSGLLASVFHTPAITVWLCCVIAWACMFAVSCLGCRLKQKRE